MFIEGGKQAGEIVQVGAQEVRLALVGHLADHFAELHQAGGQRLLRVVLKLKIAAHLALHLVQRQPGLAEHAHHPGVGVQQIGRGVAVEAEHLIEIEDVVAAAVLAQVGVFDRADAHRAGDVAQLAVFQIRVFRAHQVIGALLRFVEQVDQFDGAAVAGLEGAAVRTIHGAEAHMRQVHAFADEAGAPGDGENLLEMQRLALVDEIQDAVGAQGAGAVAQRRQVGGGVQVAAVRLAHDHRQRVAVLVFELVQEHALGALVLGEQAGLVEVGDHPGQVVVVGAFAAHVIRAQGHAQAAVDRVAMAQRHLVELAPQGQAVIVAGLQLDHQRPGPVGELR